MFIVEFHELDEIEIRNITTEKKLSRARSFGSTGKIEKLPKEAIQKGPPGQGKVVIKVTAKPKPGAKKLSKKEKQEKKEKEELKEKEEIMRNLLGR